MGLQFKELNIPKINTQPPQQPSPPQSITQVQNIGQPIGAPMGTPTLPGASVPHIQHKELPPPQMPGEGLQRAVNYYADYAGCGWWRMIAPEVLLNIEHKAIINGLTTMVVDPRFYFGINAVRLQRQATPVQEEFVKFLKQGAKEHGFKLIYEIDDVIFKDDIPDFNRCKAAFVDEAILQSSIAMMQMCDEISVTCQFMKEYYIDKTGNKNITVLPNYPAKMWLDNFYDKDRLMQQYELNQSRPRIAYVGSGTHIDIANKTNQHDDFFHVYESIIKTRKIFKWVFVGSFPLHCKPFIDRGEMEFIPWFPLKNLAHAYTQTNCQAVIAPLMDCTFNKAKSNIKYLEASTCGVPGTFQDLCTYKDAPFRFKTGNEMIDQIQRIVKDPDQYLRNCKAARAYADTMWLDDHLDEFRELYFTRIGEPDRQMLLKLNPDQATNVTYENQLLK